MVDQSEFEAAMNTHLFDQMASASAFDQMGATPESQQALLNQPQALVIFSYQTENLEFLGRIR